VVFKTTPFGRSGIPPPMRLSARRYGARWMAGFLAKSRTVTGPDGRAWNVRRLLLPRRPRWKGRRSGEPGEKRSKSARAGDWWQTFDSISSLGDLGELGGVGAAIAAIALVALLFVFAWFVLFPALFLLLDLIIILLIAAGGVAVRVLFRRPWKIEARTEGPHESHHWGVVGLRASADAVHTVADAIAAGMPPNEIRPAPR
jgi:hypothetical protein